MLRRGDAVAFAREKYHASGQYPRYGKMLSVAIYGITFEEHTVCACVILTLRRPYMGQLFVAISRFHFVFSLALSRFVLRLAFYVDITIMA